MPQLDGLRAVAVACVLAFHFIPGVDRYAPLGSMGLRLFFVILGAFLLGSLLLGLAALAMPGRLARGAAILLLAAVPLTVLIMLGGYAGAGWTDPITGSVYPLLQPVSRVNRITLDIDALEHEADSSCTRRHCGRR